MRVARLFAFDELHLSIYVNYFGRRQADLFAMHDIADFNVYRETCKLVKKIHRNIRKFLPRQTPGIRLKS